MTTQEAAERLGINRGQVRLYAKAIGVKRYRRVTREGIPWGFIITEADFKKIAAERRRRLYAKSERKAADMKIIAVQYRKIAHANRDKEEWLRSLMKGVRRSVEKRRRLREWRERHDAETHYYRPKPERPALHPWRAADEALFEEWTAKHNPDRED
jgi:hypothetical protein